MTEPMTVVPEIWPVAADETGIWLLSGQDAWRPALPVMADTEPHADIDLELSAHGVAEETVLLHSTSWRVDGPHIFLTYVAVVRTDGLVLDRWPDALPISTELAAAVGKPPPADPRQAPSPRYVDVLMHALRHLRFLVDTDSANRDAMGEVFRGHLQPLTPALAKMYDQAA